jgi:hypothetical protein
MSVDGLHRQVHVCDKFPSRRYGSEAVLAHGAIDDDVEDFFEKPRVKPRGERGPEGFESRVDLVERERHRPRGAVSTQCARGRMMAPPKVTSVQ